MTKAKIRHMSDQGHYLIPTKDDVVRRILSQSEEFASCAKCRKDPLEASRTISKLRLLVLEKL